MKRIRAIVNINKIDQETLLVEIDVNTLFQMLTITNKELFYLELETFERSLLNYDELDEQWISHKRRDFRTNIKWILSIIIGYLLIVFLLEFTYFLKISSKIITIIIFKF
jgi:hypothetical protein